MRRQLRSGSSLIEILVVIVVFLVGILALVQAFPPGLALLRTTRTNTVAATLAKAEMQRLLASDSQVPEMVTSVRYRSGGNIIQLEPGKNFSELMPEADVAGGVIDNTGNVLIGGLPIGKWEKVSGANQFSRVIGEGRQVPAPRAYAGQFGSPIQLRYGPIYYSRTTAYPTAGPVGLIGTPGVVQVYGNDLVRRFGNIDRLQPNPNSVPRNWEFYFSDASDADNPNPAINPFQDEDQIWVGGVKDATNTDILQPLRISFSFGYDNGGSYSQYDVIILADPAVLPNTICRQVGNFWVFNLRQLVAQPGLYGGSGFNPASFVGAEYGSCRVQRTFQEIPLEMAFDTANPYQFKMGTGQLGLIVVNPSAYNYKVRSFNGDIVPLEAKADYTVFDWRILHDDFRVPNPGGLTFSSPSIRLAIQGLMPRDSNSPDGLRFIRQEGGVNVGGLGMRTPSINLTAEVQDFLLQDVESGQIILGNEPGNANSGYTVDKSYGIVTFTDVTPGTPTIDAYLATEVTPGTWVATGAPVTLNGRTVRAYYMSRSQIAVQMHKAATNYRHSGISVAGLRAGEFYVGASQLDISATPIGQSDRIYFPLSDAGHRVVVGEIWFNRNGVVDVIRDQEFSIDGVETLLGVPHAYMNIRAKTQNAPADVISFDYSRNGYAVLKVKGASVKVRVLWNPDSFQVSTDNADNYNKLETWMRSYRKVETEGFIAGSLR